ncbi:MAG TPA: leishmanolysin-related zinc metalloendopeptidase [Longimicrobiales bacterium]|nr:leishmanolysin-related zinc metalloendopeptidase [Longimicrobiales bacterium]
MPANLTVTSGDIILTEIGDTATVTAVVRDQNGERISGAELTFSSANSGVASVAAGGLVTAEGEGSTIVTVRSGQLAASVPVFVEIPPQFTIRKEVRSWFGGVADNPASPSLAGFEFVVRSLDGAPTFDTITTNGSGVARIILDPGTYRVTESADLGLTDVTGPVDVEISSGLPFDLQWVNRQLSATNAPRAIVEASPRAVPAGDNDQTEVRLWAGNSADPNGDALTYAWEAPGGTFIGSATGPAARVTFPGGTSQTVSLTVSDGENEDTAQVQILGSSSLPAAGTLNIELVPIEPINDPDVQAAFDLAEATWESIVRNDLVDVNFANQPFDGDQCLQGIGTIEDLVDDVRIYVEFAPDDGTGGTLAAAGPCLIRTTGTANTIVGIMKFDSDDFGNLSASSLNRVILHEMAHVLGFGTLWNRNGLLENPSCPDQSCIASDPPGPDTRFTGTAASFGYRALGGLIDANVPVENERGGPGSRDGHWRESIFGTELMTGFLTNNVTNPLSILTVGALQDNGYLVDYSQVDNYSIPGDAPFPVAGDVGVLDLREDLYTGPMWGIDEDGSIVLIRSGS